MTHDDRRSWKTAIGVVLTALMLFPVYWMINVSLTQDSDMRDDPPDLFPLHRTFEGYRAVLRPATALPRHQPAHRPRHRRCSRWLLAAPAGYALAKLRPRGGGVLELRAAGRPDDPGHHHGDGLLRHLPQPRAAQHRAPGLIVADSTIAVPFGVLIFTAFMSGIPGELIAAARIDGAGTWRTFWSVVLPVSRNADRHRLPVRLPVGLVGLRLRHHPRRRRRHCSPITLGIYHYIGNNNQQWNAIMATAVVASIPAAVLLILAQRYVAAGVTAGAVKD